jgi:hypothetical protein
MTIKTIVRCRWVALRFLFWAAVAIVPSCAGDATPGSRLSAMRVLGARTQVVADPTQSWPRPGEAFRVTWLLAGPAAPRPAGWAFRAHACATNQDAAACRATGVAVPANVPGSDRGSSPGSVLATALAVNATAGDAFPSVELTVPDAATVAARGLTKLIVDGVVCGGGTAGNLDAPAWSRCDGAPTDGQGPVDETDVETTVVIRLDEDGNQAPTLGDDPFTWEGQPWTAGADDAPNAGGGITCAAQPGALLIPAGDEVRTITVTTDDADRGTHPVKVPAAGKPDHEREELQLSAFTTAGSFETQFGAVSGSDPAAAPSITVKWTPPEVKDDPVPAEGRLVRFVFVLRDLRGGIDWTTRTICLTPNTE